MRAANTKQTGIIGIGSENDNNTFSFIHLYSLVTVRNRNIEGKIIIDYSVSLAQLISLVEMFIDQIFRLFTRSPLHCIGCFLVIAVYNRIGAVYDRVVTICLIKISIVYD